jgi:hypothetical protein
MVQPTFTTPLVVTMPKTDTSNRLEGRLYISDEFRDPKCCIYIQEKGVAKRWESERDACLTGQYCEGIGHGVLLRIQYVGKALNLIPNALFTAIGLSFGACLCVTSAFCCINCCFQRIICCCEAAKDSCESSEGALKGGLACCGIGAFTLGEVILETTLLPGNVICPEFQSGVLNQHAIALKMEKQMDALNQVVREEKEKMSNPSQESDSTQ